MPRGGGGGNQPSSKGGAADNAPAALLVQQQQSAAADGGGGQQQRKAPLYELICFRALDGRPCSAVDTARRLRPNGANVVVVEVPPPRRRNADVDGAAAAVDSVAATAAAVLSALRAADIPALHDACGRGETPGARFFVWEEAGAAVRVEIGAREAAQRSATLALHPELVGASGALARLSRAPELSGLLQEASGSSSSSSSSGGRALRLGPVPIENVAQVVRAVLNAFGDSVTGDRVTTNAAAAAPMFLPQGKCSKLHLWPPQPRQQQAPPGPCPVHVRHLAHAGPPCYCRIRHHITMAELRAEAAARAPECTGRSIVGWAGASDAPPPPRLATLFVGNLPRSWPVAALRARLTEALAPFAGAAAGEGVDPQPSPTTLNVRVAQGARGRTRGWARVQLPSEAVQRAIDQLDGRLAIGPGPPASVSRATGRADALFPHLAFDARCALRIDDTAAYSAMDAGAAADMAALAATVTAAAAGRPFGQPARQLLPLACADVTACCGGTTMGLARAFARVTAVELDAHRCLDLAHNLRVAGINVAAAAGAPDTPDAGGGDGGALVTVVCGDAVALLPELGRHDCVVVDPPWGGPAYLAQGGKGGGDGGSSSENSDGGSDNEGSAATADEQLQQPARKRPAAAATAADDMPLGGEPLSRFCARLPQTLSAKTAVVRLPSRGFDLAAFAARVAAESSRRGGPAPLMLSSDFGRSRLLLIVYNGALTAAPSGAHCDNAAAAGPSGSRRWQLCASHQAVCGRDGAVRWRLPEPCALWVPEAGEFERCERDLVTADYR